MVRVASEQITIDVRTALGAYLETHPDNLLKDTDAMIFGGALRDIIAGDEINDIDIVSYSHGGQVLLERLEEMGYKNIKSNDETYYKIYAIEKVMTLVNGDKTIQLVRPKNPNLKGDIRTLPETHSLECWTELIKFVADVDIICCSLIYSPLFSGVIETHPNTINQCLRKIIKINKDSKLKTDREEDRIKKLQDKGWIMV